MKVLHVLYQSLPNTAGSSIRSRDIINAQLEIGLEPIVITSPFQAPFNYGNTKEEINGVVYYRTFSNKNEMVSEKKSSFFIQIRKFFRLISFSYQVYRIAKKEKIDVVHAHAMFFCAIAAKITSVLLRKPMIYEIRSLWEERFKDLSFLNKIIFSCVTSIESFSMFMSDHLVVINKALKEELSQRILLKNKKMTVVGNAVDLDRVRLIDVKRENIVFGYIGTLSPIEGLNLLIESFNNLRFEGFQNRLLIFGDGIDIKRLKLQAEGNSLIEFKGRFSPKDIADVYSKVDVVINPRISNFLTNSVTPLKPLEAMAYKKLVLASDIAGMKELVEDGKTGLLFKSDSVEEIEKVILNVIGMQDFHYLIDNAFNYILDKRNWKKNIETYNKIYLTLING
jgi:glycosyltransferase involved in cell wall biosynthesis